MNKHKQQRFGTLETCEDLSVDNKVKIEFFNKQDALNALSSKNLDNVQFFIDEFPEYNPPLLDKSTPSKEDSSQVNERKHVKEEPFETRSIRMIKQEAFEPPTPKTISPPKMNYSQEYTKTLLKNSPMKTKQLIESHSLKKVNKRKLLQLLRKRG